MDHHTWGGGPENTVAQVSSNAREIATKIYVTVNSHWVANLVSLANSVLRI